MRCGLVVKSLLDVRRYGEGSDGWASELAWVAGVNPFIIWLGSKAFDPLMMVRDESVFLEGSCWEVPGVGALVPGSESRLSFRELHPAW